MPWSSRSPARCCLTAELILEAAGDALAGGPCTAAAEAAARSADPAAARCFDLAFSVEPSGQGRGRTYVDEQLVRYPLHLGCGLYLDERDRGRCTVSLQSVSGGLFGGDRIHGRTRARTHAQARVQTAAATVVHAMTGGCAEQLTELIAEDHATLAFMPEHLVLFPGSRLRSSTKVVLGERATVLLRESFLPHAIASRTGPFGSLDSRVEVRAPSGRLLVQERMLLDGDSWCAQQVGISGPHAVHGTVWLLAPHAEQACLLDALRSALAARPCAAAASALPNGAGVQARILSRDAVAFLKTMNAVEAVAAELQPGASLASCPESAST